MLSKRIVSLVVEMQVIRETGVAVVKDWGTSRTMFFQGGVYVTSPNWYVSYLAIF